jgi:hypothetical protein
MKAIITNESTEQNSLDKLKDLIIGEYPHSFWKDPDIFKDLQALVDKSIHKKVNGMINDWACAKCDSDRGIIEEKPYCAVCGQKLDWSDK